MRINKLITRTFLVLISALGISSCAIQPLAWDPPLNEEKPLDQSDGSELTKSEQIHLLGYSGAEEFALDSKGNLYCGAHPSESDFSSGIILKINPEDGVEEYLRTDHWITGMQFDNEDRLFALMNGVGLVMIKPDKSIDTLLTHTPDGNPIMMGTGLKIASDGTIYFANMSTTQETSMKYVNRLILEMKPTGGVYSYQPNTGKVESISTGNYFGNGLALSDDETYLLLSETSKYRVIKYWLKGEKRGTSEVLMENLPGFPNNIVKRQNGNYWLGFTTKRNGQLDKIHPKPGMKRFVYGLPSFVQPKPEKFGMIMEISPVGVVVQVFSDNKGAVVPEAGALLEVGGYLYIGGDVVKNIAKYKL